MPEIVIENIEHSEESIMFYTGLPDFLTFQYVFEIESLTENGTWKLCSPSVGEMNMYSLRQKLKLRRVKDFVIALMRLILVFLVKDLEFLFKISRFQCEKLPIQSTHHIH